MTGRNVYDELNVGRSGGQDKAREGDDGQAEGTKLMFYINRHLSTGAPSMPNGLPSTERHGDAGAAYEGGS